MAGSSFAYEAPDVSLPRVDMRRQILSQYKFTPHPGESSPVLSPGAVAQPAPAAATPSDVVTMPTYTVRETMRTNAITAALAEQKSDARAEMMMGKLGVGFHVVPLGKFRLYAGTIFFIPFTAGIGFSW
jgi:hypothetical protein